jgi:DNA-binding IclR family transcriptional regulator
MPLFYGATAKIILANLPERRLVKLFLNHRIEIAKAGLGEEWEDFKRHLAEMRQLGYCISRGEVDPGAIGVGTAIFADEKTVIGSLTHVVLGTDKEIDESITSRLIDGCNRISAEIERILQAHDDMLDSYSPVIPFKKSGS